jgi:hypothetical protein
MHFLSSARRENDASSVRSSNLGSSNSAEEGLVRKTRWSNVGRKGSTGVANHRGKVGSPRHQIRNYAARNGYYARPLAFYAVA